MFMFLDYFIFFKKALDVQNEHILIELDYHSYLQQRN